jgi:hypothetical protein
MVQIHQVIFGLRANVKDKVNNTQVTDKSVLIIKNLVVNGQGNIGLRPPAATQIGYPLGVFGVGFGKMQLGIQL